MGKKNFLLAANGNIVSDMPMGIVHTNWSETIPYKIDAATSTFDNVNIEVLKTTSGATGGTIVFKLYKLDANYTQSTYITTTILNNTSVSTKFFEEVITVPPNSDLLYSTNTYDIGVDLTSTALICAMITITGDVVLEDTYADVRYDDTSEPNDVAGTAYIDLDHMVEIDARGDEDNNSNVVAWNSNQTYNYTINNALIGLDSFLVTNPNAVLYSSFGDTHHANIEVGVISDGVALIKVRTATYTQIPVGSKIRMAIV